MTMSAPPATGVRTPWEAVPEPVRRAVAELLGAPVVEAVTQTGGFSPGPAARVRTADGRRAFVKAVSAEANPDSPDMHRREARNAAALPAETPAPRLLGMHDDGNWVALVFEDIDGRQPHVPWEEGELACVLDAVGELGRTLTPSPLDVPPVGEALSRAFRGWQKMLDEGRGARAGDRGEGLDPWTVRNLPVLAELAAPWAEFASGDTLAHGDLRADNILLTAPENAPHRVLFVDWPHAQLAAPWFDLLVMLPCVRAQGGPDPEVLFTEHPLGRAADPAGVTATLAALAGYFVGQSRRPSPPGLPTLRVFQRAQGDAALEWLRKRLGPGRT
ncbi:aminoglycoside phosphotransferase family protein [Streptomyces phaeochromogenes]|uniref:phosphotransferase family protein n=1 Tax=Streptomyces phaeochromogenes TaxID=1923 RepID=UPI002DD9DEEE|nr:aminoglycoside phosphotransferase family protein [Streptomyces phaeochromogenes]WRZ33576.1 aminoglycoside phosphotransferase family protein [Streptomyces phaeochromogenes]